MRRLDGIEACRCASETLLSPARTRRLREPGAAYADFSYATGSGTRTPSATTNIITATPSTASTPSAGRVVGVGCGQHRRDDQGAQQRPDQVEGLCGRRTPSLGPLPQLHQTSSPRLLLR